MYVDVCVYMGKLFICVYVCLTPPQEVVPLPPRHPGPVLAPKSQLILDLKVQESGLSAQAFTRRLLVLHTCAVEVQTPPVAWRDCVHIAWPLRCGRG